MISVRPVAKVNYFLDIVYVRFVGTHAEYDDIDAESHLMNIQPIRTEQDYQRALTRAAQLMDAEAGTAEGDELDMLATLVKVYEDRHFPMGPVDPLAAGHPLPR